MSNNQRKWLAIAAVAIAVLAALAWLLRDPPIPVDLHKVEVSPLRVTIDEEGVSHIRDIYRVSAPITGRVKRSPLRVGDPVRKGKTVVATIEPVTPNLLDVRSHRTLKARAEAARAAVQLAEAGLVRSKADLRFNARELDRAKALIRRNTISQRRFDESRLAHDIAVAAVRTAEAELEVRKRELESTEAQLIEPGTDPVGRTSRCCVRSLAPVSGRVIRLLTESEQVVSSGTPLVEIGDPSDLEIVADLLSTDAVRIREGAAAEIVSWGGGKPLRAKVRRIEPTGFKKVSALGVDEQRVKVRLSLDDPLESWSRLGHDYRVFVRIMEWRQDRVLSVPLGALFREGADWAVFVSEDGRVQTQVVSIGHKNGEHAQVTKGLSEGDVVVLHPNDRVANGVRIVDRKTLN